MWYGLRWVGALLVLCAPLWSADGTVNEIIAFLASDDLQGRAPKTQQSEDARAYLQAQLERVGARPASKHQDTGFVQDFGDGVNLIAVLPDKQGRIERPAVLLSAHYDHLNDCRAASFAASSVCNGAADNAAGVAALLVAAEALSGQTARPVALAFWDAEETGMLGSRHFAANPWVVREDLQLILNFDIIGLNLFPQLSSHHFVIGAETGGRSMVDLVAEAGGKSPLDLVQLSYAFGHARNDLTSFTEAGWTTPTLFFTDGDGSIYHTSADEVSRINFDKVRESGRLAAHITRAVVDGVVTPEAAPPQVEGLYAAPRFEDVRSLRLLLVALRDKVKPGGMHAMTLKGMIQSFEALEKAGPDQFSPRDMRDLLYAAKTVLSLSRQSAATLGRTP